MGFQEVLRRGGWEGGFESLASFVRETVSLGVGVGAGTHAAVRVCAHAGLLAASGRQPLCSGRNLTINNSRCGVLLGVQKDCDSVTWPGRLTRSFLPHDTAEWGQ